MSHAPERKEKDCLNCGTIVHGRFCHICGQENIVPRESFWHLVTHFFYDITHFDSKFFATLKYLIFRPGFLSKEYLKGRRASYLNPIKMYVFTSAIFFLLFFSFFYSDSGANFSTTINGKTLAEIDAMDSATFAAFTANINKEDEKPATPMTRQEFKSFKDGVINVGINVGGTVYRSKAQYDSMLATGQKKHNWIQRQLIYKQIAINEKYNRDTNQIFKAFNSTLVHSLPQMLFISLPLLALILKLIYIRRKRFFYVSHGIFSVHLYIFLFIAMLFLFAIAEANSYLHWRILRFIFPFLVLWLFVYQYSALKNFYQQGWLKTFFKFILINLLFVVVIGLLFFVFVFFSLFKI
ncbi:MAG TPA: DUF3667 domain-containing protein [Chitinophagaceae bacterium]|nr:DUF3667 domain-containing protein [Chitinophagaceae bacterium]